MNNESNYEIVKEYGLSIGIPEEEIEAYVRKMALGFSSM